MEYKDIIIEASDFRQLGKDSSQFRVRIIQSPAGEMAPEKAMSVSYNPIELKEAIQKLEERALDREGLISLGRTLGALLLPAQASGGSVRDLFAQSLMVSEAAGGVRLRLRLPAMLASIPWEYVYLDRVDGGGGWMASLRWIRVS